MRCKTQDILKHANNFSKISCELKKEVDELEIEINCLNQVYILLCVSNVFILMYKYNGMLVDSLRRAVFKDPK